MFSRGLKYFLISHSHILNFPVMSLKGLIANRNSDTMDISVVALRQIHVFTFVMIASLPLACVTLVTQLTQRQIP